MVFHKRYLLFIFDDYYPSGGLGDLIGTYDTIEEVVESLEKEGKFRNVQIYDRVEGIEIDQPN